MVAATGQIVTWAPVVDQAVPITGASDGTTPSKAGRCSI
jgi:hypothetical protein